MVRGLPFHIPDGLRHRFMEDNVGGQNVRGETVAVPAPYFFGPTSSGFRQIG